MSTDNALVIQLKYILIIKQNIIVLTNQLDSVRLVNKKYRITKPTFKHNLAKITERIVGACTWALGNQ